jgi:hypothetical protein
MSQLVFAFRDIPVNTGQLGALTTRGCNPLVGASKRVKMYRF